MIESLHDPEEVRITSSGFLHLVGNAYRYKAHTISNDQQWNFDADIAGFLHNANNNEPTWKCRQNPNNTWVFHRNQCLQEAINGKSMCTECHRNRHNFFKLCRREVELRQRNSVGDVVQGRYDQMEYKSPTLVGTRIRKMGHQIHTLRNCNYKLNLVVQMLKADNVDVSNVDEETLFDPKDLTRCYEKMMSSDEIAGKEIMSFSSHNVSRLGKGSRPRVQPVVIATVASSYNLLA